ncbi:MAG: hypothetical protein HQK54_17490 [Oligoflexales bacterium]|nr:hypothetical protein [Oligoflexales bacterium]
MGNKFTKPGAGLDDKKEWMEGLECSGSPFRNERKNLHYMFSFREDAMKDKNKTAVEIPDLMYYFDAQQRDSIDIGSKGNKLGQFLLIKDKLLSLPDAEFRAAIQTIQRMVSSPQDQKTKDEGLRRKDAMKLFTQVSKGGEGNSTSKVTPV